MVSMGSKTNKILHIGTEKSWRGGENQILILIANAPAGFQHFIAYPHKSRGLFKFSDLGYSTIPFLRSPLLAWMESFRLAQYCKMQGIAILHAHSSRAHSLALKIKFWCPHLKLVVHRRVDDALISKGKYLNSKVDHFIAISRAVFQTLKAAGVDSQKISLIFSSVELSKFANVDRQNSNSHMPLIIGNAAAFTSQKGHETLLRALAILKNQNILWRCVLAGDGVLLETTKKLAAELGIAERVEFLGYQKDVATVLRGIDIFAMPSNNEGLGSIFLDAILSGCAVCATEVGGIPEIIQHNVTGLLSQPGDSEQLASNIALLINSADLRLRLQKQAKEHVTGQFSSTTMIQKTHALYGQLVDTHWTPGLHALKN